MNLPYGKVFSFINFVALLTVLPAGIRLFWPTLIDYLTGNI